MQKDNIILVGMMGSGKSTIGRALAQKLKWNFFDLDFEIEKEHGKISDIFKNQGEQYFRKIEKETLKRFSDKKNCVISTGGGTVLDKENRFFIKEIAEVFFLSASAQTIYDRIKNQTHRPLLATENPREKIEEILNSRESIYNSFKEKITTDNKTIEEIVEELYEKVSR